MGLTNFPNGVASRGVPLSGGDIPVSGNVFFVGATSTNSNMSAGVNDSASYGSTPEKPFATIVYAMAQCTAGNNDVIYVLPGHTESVSGAAYLTPKAGVSIIGLGTGSNRPQLSWTATASTIVCSANNVTFRNMIFKPGIAEVVTGFTVSGNWSSFIDCDVIPNSTFCFVKFITVTAASSYVRILGGSHLSTTAAATNGSWIFITGHATTSVGHRIEGLTAIIAVPNGASHGIEVNTTATVGCMVTKNNILLTGGNGSAVGMALIGSTGMVTDNRIFAGTTAIAGVQTGSATFYAENYVANTADASGLLDPAVDS